MNALNNEKKEDKNLLNIRKTKKKSRKLYWLIVIVGMTVIMFLSMNIGYNVNKIFNGNNNGNTNIDKNMDKKNENKVEVKLLSEDEALTIGYELYNNGKKDFYNKIYTKDGCISATVGGEYYMDCTELYNKLEQNFAKENKVGRSNSTMSDIYIDFIKKNSDGNKYLDTTGESFVGEVQTSLTVTEITESQITFTASSIVLVPDSSNVLVVDRTEENEFVIVKEEDNWKISYLVALGV